MIDDTDDVEGVVEGPDAPVAGVDEQNKLEPADEPSEESVLDEDEPSSE